MMAPYHPRNLYFPHLQLCRGLELGTSLQWFSRRSLRSWFE